MAKNRKRYISIMFIPDDNASTFQIRIRIGTLKIIGYSCAVFLLFVIIGAVSYWKVAEIAFRTSRIAYRNELLEKERMKITQLAGILARNRETDRQIRKLASGVIDMKGTGGGNWNPDMELNIRRRMGMRLIAEGEEPPPGEPRSLVPTKPFAWPVHGGWITKEFSPGNPRTDKAVHLGLDIAAKAGTPVMAGADGVVTFAGWSSDLGNIIIIDHGNGYLTRYGHNSRVLVSKGDIINQGKIIAFVGSSGRSSAPHLHFEVCRDGVPVNPRDYLLR